MTLTLIYAILQKCQSINYIFIRGTLFINYKKRKVRLMRFFGYFGWFSNNINYVTNRNFLMKISCLYWNEVHTVDRVADALWQNKIILCTSDTILGLFALLTEDGYDKLNKIKGRSDKPYIVLIGSHEKISLFVEKPLSSTVQTLIDHCWPGPLTLILKAKKDVPSFLQSAQGKIALRMPNHQGLLLLLKRFDGLFSTSANKTNMPVPYTIEAVDSLVVRQVAYCVLDSPEQKEILSMKSSTILDCTGSTIHIVREGAYSVAKLIQYVGNNFEK